MAMRLFPSRFVASRISAEVHRTRWEGEERKNQEVHTRMRLRHAIPMMRGNRLEQIARRSRAGSTRACATSLRLIVDSASIRHLFKILCVFACWAAKPFGYSGQVSSQPDCGSGYVRCTFRRCKRIRNPVVHSRLALAACLFNEERTGPRQSRPRGT